LNAAGNEKTEEVQLQKAKETKWLLMMILNKTLSESLLRKSVSLTFSMETDFQVTFFDNPISTLLCRE